MVKGAPMLTRRELIASAAVTATASTLSPAAASSNPVRPVAVGSANGLRAVARTVERMRAGVDLLDSVIEGINIIEEDPADMTVGYGGVPNEEGVVQLDACVMHGPTARAGAVASLEGVKTPSKVARKVMETTDHVLLVGPGARRFAEMHGFPFENLLTEKARKVWLYWKQNLSPIDKWLEPDPEQIDPDVKAFVEEYGTDSFRNPRSNGTVHVSAVDAKGDLAGCTSTSGLFFKMPGRVGDSPLIGAGCFTDNEVGSAGSTGRGEANILVAGAHTIVELMRGGRSPREACLEALKRVAASTKDKRLLDKKGRPAFGLRFYAVNKAGAYAGASMWGAPKDGKPAQFAVADARGARLEDCVYLFEGKPAR
jgi:N4-(beta-N-acetylglucosaminyl)-L-asparaginase